MPRTKSQEVTLVGVKGVSLPATSGLLVAEDTSALTLKVTEKTGRGRGVKMVERTYVIPKSSVAYYSYDVAVEGAAAEPAAADAAPKKRGRPAKAAAAPADAAPKKRGRPAKAKTDDAAPKRRGRPPKAKADGGEDAAPKRRGRPPKAKTEGGEDAAPKRRGRPPKAKTDDAAPKKRGRPAKAKTDDAAPKKRGRPPKAAAAEPKNTEAPQSKGGSLFDDNF